MAIQAQIGAFIHTAVDRALWCWLVTQTREIEDRGGGLDKARSHMRARDMRSVAVSSLTDRVVAMSSGSGAMERRQRHLIKIDPMLPPPTVWLRQSSSKAHFLLTDKEIFSACSTLTSWLCLGKGGQGLRRGERAA